MLTALAKHGGMSLELKCKGDLWIDDHHTAEDCAIALGDAFKQALGERRGIKRYGSAYAPLDEVCGGCDVVNLEAYADNLSLAHEGPFPSRHRYLVKAVLCLPLALHPRKDRRLYVSQACSFTDSSLIINPPVSTEMIPHLLQSFAFAAGVTLHIDWIRGENNHHM